MPFKSKAQRGALFARDPAVARRFQEESDGASLPGRFGQDEEEGPVRRRKRPGRDARKLKGKGKGKKRKHGRGRSKRLSGALLARAIRSRQKEKEAAVSSKQEQGGSPY